MKVFKVFLQFKLTENIPLDGEFFQFFLIDSFPRKSPSESGKSQGHVWFVPIGAKVCRAEV